MAQATPSGWLGQNTQQLQEQTKSQRIIQARRPCLGQKAPRYEQQQTKTWHSHFHPSSPRPRSETQQRTRSTTRSWSRRHRSGFSCWRCSRSPTGERTKKDKKTPSSNKNYIHDDSVWARETWFNCCPKPSLAMCDCNAFRANAARSRFSTDGELPWNRGVRQGQK